MLLSLPTTSLPTTIFPRVCPLSKVRLRMPIVFTLGVAC
jgi:hypothetical protein